MLEGEGEGYSYATSVMTCTEYRLGGGRGANFPTDFIFGMALYVRAARADEIFYE